MTRPNNKLTPRSRERGFTMIELMTTVIVFAVLTAVALPSFRSFIVGQRIKTASFDLMSTLIMARSEAIKRNSSVSISPNGGSWLNGWVVSAGATVLKQQNLLGSGLLITCYSGTSSTPCQPISYSGSGRLAPGIIAQTVKIASNDSGTATGFGTRCIGIDLTGRPRSAKTGCP